jgi:hypothetical protein
MAHARHKLHDLYASHRSDIAEEGLRYFAARYEIEREGRELKLDADGRRLLRQQRSNPPRKPCGDGSLDNAARCRMTPPQEKRSITASDAGRR